MSKILNNEQIIHKTRRIAYQIYEDNNKESEIVVAGIVGNGYIFAQRIVEVLSEISSIKIILCQLTMDKSNPLKEATTDIETSVYQDKSLILVDDVLDSGTTLMYGIKHFLNVPLKKFKTAVLVNRNHKKYPVKADYKGISLSTSLEEHISVKFGQESYAELE